MCPHVATVVRMTALMLAEPEASVRGFLAQQLASDGFDVLAFENPDELPRSAEPDVLVLGDPEALERCRIGNCAVIVLGRADASERVRALEHCDDYLTRPFAYEELVARIRAVLRRRSPRQELVDLGQLVVDRAARRVLVRGKEVKLASKEYALLLRMAQDPDRVFTREQLLRDVWGYRTFVPTRTVESHASRVRCKLAAAGLPGWIVNVWGVGYSLRPAFLQDVDPVQEVLDPGELGHLDHEHRHEDDEHDEPHVFVIAGAAGMGIRDRPDPSDGKATI